MALIVHGAVLLAVPDHAKRQICPRIPIVALVRYISENGATLWKGADKTSESTRRMANRRLPRLIAPSRGKPGLVTGALNPPLMDPKRPSLWAISAALFDKSTY